ncbi:hypothetical protein VNO78_23564 [Psophocarpus tetragonolobus]|uniref:Uncharacterized protein n=1 Tax=Psophocarpus tetragonolobus TaxID=3891 RepID=A0AAN9XDZ5_PSOTE
MLRVLWLQRGDLICELPAMAALNNAVPVLVHVLLYNALMVSNDQLAQGPNGSWKNMITLKPELHKSSISQTSLRDLGFQFWQT